MTTKMFTGEEWIESLRGIGDLYKISVPVREDNFHNFRTLEQGVMPDFDLQNSRLSPKSIIYPQSERLFECPSGMGDPETGLLKEALKDYPPQAIIGIRPCDAHAFQIVKRNFDNPEYRDPWWVRRFESTLLVGLGCNEPCPTCFCTSVGGGPFDEERLDVLLYNLRDGLLAKGLNEKGDQFIEKIMRGRPAGELELKDAAALRQSAQEKMTSDVPVERLREKAVNGLFAAPFWDEVAFACINCGTCTFLCPTCWCFDIQDEISGRHADRIRNWDSCMYPLFTLEASGHNPREKKTQRVRQRFMHKLKYYVDRFQNGVQCSGCGRCVRYCPVNIDIRHVARLMNEYNA